MKNRASGLLAEIQRDVLDESKPLAGTLRKCIALGGESGSTRLRDWASHEASGYSGDDELPDYRVIGASIQLDGVTMTGIVKSQTISAKSLPDFAAEKISEELPLRQAVGLLEELAKEEDSVKFSLPLGPELAMMMNQNKRYQQIERLYWSVSPAVIHGVVDRVRTVLTELVSELRAGMPSDAEVPSADLANKALQVAVYGEKARVNVTAAQVGNNGTATARSGSEDSDDSPFWTTSRTIGAFVVGAFTIAGAIAAVVALVH